MIDEHVPDNPPSWIDDLRELIWNNWWPHGPNRTLNWSLEPDGEGGWMLRVCPVYQEIYGGDRDGEVVWTPFIFDAGVFLQQIDEDFEIEGFSVASYDERLDTLPMFLVKAERDGVSVIIAIQLEPPKEKHAAEIIDAITGEVRPKEVEPD